MVTKKPTKKSLDADTWIHPLDDLLARQASILEISESMDSSIVDQGDIRYIAQNALRIKRRAPWLLDKSYSEEDFLDDVVALIAAENDEFEKLNSEVKLTRASISKVTKELQKLNFQFMEKIRELTTNGAPYIHALHDIKKAVNRKHGSKILSESLIIVSVADFETFVSRMFGLVIKHNKGIYSNQDSKLKWKDISKFSSIEDAEDFLISSKRQEFTHLSMREWLDWFGKHSNVVMPPQVRKHVLQTYEVRNTLVHKSSHKVKLPKDFDIETLEVFLDLLGATAIIISAGTASVALKKELNTLVDFESRLTAFGLELLQQERYSLVALLGESLIKVFTESEAKAAMQVNYWIAKKKLGLTKGLQEEITNWKTTSLPETYELARAALLDNREEAKKLFVQLLEAGDLDPTYWNAWPLFDWVRIDGELLPV